ncbi:MAG: hypothetical protein IKB28_08355 [Clostridia bacterium]|nr:hypothetical protein [Clostridia bacterium]
MRKAKHVGRGLAPATLRMSLERTRREQAPALRIPHSAFRIFLSVSVDITQ